MSERKEIRKSLQEKIEGCTIVSINGSTYFGKLVKGEGSNKLVNAVESNEDLTSTAKLWVKEYNLGNLKTIEVSGDATFAVQTLTENQEEEIEAVVILASRAMATALPELINGKF